MTLKAKLFLVLFLLIISKMSMAQSGGGANGAYFAFDWNMNAAQSDSDFNNGASGGSPGLLVGYQFPGFAFEGFYKKITLENKHNNSLGNFDVTIENDLLGAALRVNHNPYFSSKFGYGMHNVTANYKHSAGLKFASTIDGAHSGFFAGTGLKGQLSGNFEFYADLSFYLASSEFSLFAMEVGLRYYAF
jgi:hypothetical protein